MRRGLARCARLLILSAMTQPDGRAVKRGSATVRSRLPLNRPVISMIEPHYGLFQPSHGYRDLQSDEAH